MLSPRFLANDLDFKGAYQKMADLQVKDVLSVKPSSELEAITRELSAGSEAQKGEALLSLFDFSKKFIPGSMMTVGKIDTAQMGVLYDAQTIFELIRKERIILLSDLKDKSGTVIISGNKDLLDALVAQGVVDGDLAAGTNGLVLSPMRDDNPYLSDSETLHNRSFYETGNEEIDSGTIVWKGIGSSSINNRTGLPFNIQERAEDNWIYGGATVEEVDETSRRALQLGRALNNIRAFDADVPADLFFKPAVSIQPLYLPVKAEGDFVSLRDRSYRLGKEVRPGVFLAPIKEMPDLFKFYEGAAETRLKLLEQAADKMRFYAYISPAPWRIRELWSHLPVIEKKLGTEDRVEMYNDFIDRYAYTAALIHGYLDAVGASRAVLSGSNLSSMFSVNNMGYNIFDYHLLKTKTDYVREYIVNSVKAEVAGNFTGREWMLNNKVLSLISGQSLSLEGESFVDYYLSLAAEFGVPKEYVNRESAQAFFNAVKSALAEFFMIRDQELVILKSTVDALSGDILGYGLDPGRQRDLVLQAKKNLEDKYRQYLKIFMPAENRPDSYPAEDSFGSVPLSEIKQPPQNTFSPLESAI